VTLFRIRATFLRRTVTPLRTGGIFLRVLLRITPYPTHWDIPAIRRAFELFHDISPSTRPVVAALPATPRASSLRSLACTLSLSLSISRTRVLSPPLASLALSRKSSLLSFSLSLMLSFSLSSFSHARLPLARVLSLSHSRRSAGSSHFTCRAMSRAAYPMPPLHPFHRPSLHISSPAPRGISAKGGMPSGEPCPRPDAKDTSCPLRPCCALARAECAAEVVVRMQKIHPERFAHAAHFLVQKIHPDLAQSPFPPYQAC
jgi:hypothetical protein